MKVHVDVVADSLEDLEQLLNEVETNFLVQAKVVDRTGPAGGNPVVSLEGSRTDIDAALRSWNFADGINSVAH